MNNIPLCDISYLATKRCIWISCIGERGTNASDSYRKSHLRRPAGPGGLEIERIEELNEIIPRWERAAFSRVSLARSIGIPERFVYWLRNFRSPATRQVFQSRGEHSCILDRRRVRTSRRMWNTSGFRVEIDVAAGVMKKIPLITQLWQPGAPSLNRTEYPTGGILSVGYAVNLIPAIRVGQLERCSRFALERSTEVRCLKLLLALIGFPRGYTSSGAAFSSRLVRRVSTNFASTKRTWEPRSCFWFPLCSGWDGTLAPLFPMSDWLTRLLFSPCFSLLCIAKC